MQVHDEVIYECDENLIEDVALKIKKIMEDVLKDKDDKNVPLIANGYSGKNWGGMIQLIL